MKHANKLLAGAALAVILLSGCKIKDPEPETVEHVEPEPALIAPEAVPTGAVKLVRTYGKNGTVFITEEYIFLSMAACEVYKKHNAITSTNLEVVELCQTQ